MAAARSGRDLFDKLPPQNLDAERSVLGSMLLSHEAIDEVGDLLQPRHFYGDAHRRIAEAIFRLAETTVGGIDAVTVAEELERRKELEEIGGAPYLAQLLESVPHAAHARYYAEIVRDKYVLRSLQEACTAVLRDVGDESQEVSELLTHAEERIFQILEQQGEAEQLEIREILMSAFDSIHARMSQDGMVSGVSTGFSKLDDLTSGLHPQSLVILAARPSMGKTAFVCNLAKTAAMNAKREFDELENPGPDAKPKGVVIFSLEQSKIELAERLLCILAKFDGHKLRKGEIDPDEHEHLLRTASQLGELPIYIDDQPGRSMGQISAICRRVKRRFGLGLVVIDYLQLIEPEDKKAPREQQVAQIARRLKFLAKEMNVPVIALAQLNRGVDLRQDKQPKLADLRECVPGDTLVVLADGRRMPIAELVAQTPHVLAVSSEGRLVEAVAEKVWCVGRRPIFQIRLTSGRTIRATAGHRLYGANGWIRVDELRIGDRLAIARRLPEPVVTDEWPDEHVALLGHLIGDGSYLSGQPLRYCTSSEENSRFVCDAATTAFQVRATRHAGRGKWHTVVFSGNGNRWHPAGVNRWLRELGIFGQRSFEKRIPQAAFRLSNRQIALLLRHLWATDGCISVRKAHSRGSMRIFFSTNSERLALDVAALLLRLGIVARIRSFEQRGYRPAFTADISGLDHQLIFLRIVGGFGPREAPAALAARWLSLRTGPNPNVDTLPKELFRYVRTQMAQKGISQRAMAAARGTAFGGMAHFRFAPSRKVMTEYAEILDDDTLRQHATSDLFWDRVREIAPCGEETVYDLTVPGPASWLADGIASHNSGAIEQDADIVMFLHRPDAYDPADRPGEAEVIVAKNRNGPTGIAPLVWLRESLRFGERAPHETVGGMSYGFDSDDGGF